MKSEKWLKEKLGYLKTYASKTKLTKHEEERVGHKYWVISSLFLE
jgi:hypothetical protein